MFRFLEGQLTDRSFDGNDPFCLPSYAVVGVITSNRI
jgi:hypothetical protein